ncbi:unnamed protein product [Blepharisma stoltei]|uniref:PB1 domain-containing protein n=1 Tax=Blepharisma stoltei TaxID=1481888 RepID=A0AAU9J120_9CILI|nr:unnamed protein product [Blepharisma stoltei]
MSSRQRFIKVKYLDDFLKFENKDNNFNDFKRRVKLAAPEIETEIIFHYLDRDGDKISVRNQETFEIFLEECESMKLDLSCLESKNKQEIKIKNESPKEKSDTASDEATSIKEIKKEISARPPYQGFAKTESKISLASILSDFNVKYSKKPSKNWPIEKIIRAQEKETNLPVKGIKWSTFDSTASLDKDPEKDENKNNDTFELPLKRSIDTQSTHEQILDIENYDPAQDEYFLPMKKQKINYQSIDGFLDRKEVLPLAKKIEIKNSAIDPLFDLINDFFVFPEQSNPILYGEPTPFFTIISQIIKTCAKKFGLRKTSIFFNLESDFCFFLFRDPQEFDTSKIDSFHEYYSSDAKGENYQFPKINPKICYGTAHDIKAKVISREQALNSVNTSSANLAAWVEIFDAPLNRAPLHDSFPNLFRFKIVSDYLDGKFCIEDLEELFNVTKKHIQRWAHFFSDGKNVPKELLEKEDKRTKKFGYIPKPKRERVLDLRELMNRGPKITKEKKSKERITDQIVAAYNLISSQKL